MMNISESTTVLTNLTNSSMTNVMSVKSAFDSLNRFLASVFSSVTLTMGLVVILIGIIFLLKGIFAHHNKQPAGKDFIFAVIAFLIGGILVGPSAFNAIKNFSQKTGNGTLDELQK